MNNVLKKSIRKTDLQHFPKDEETMDAWIFRLTLLISVFFCLLWAVESYFLKLAFAFTVANSFLFLSGTTVFFLHLYSDRYQKVASHLYSFLTIVALNSFWLLNGGSNGPTLFIFAAQIALIAHFSSRKPPVVLSFIFAANIIILFYIEWKGIFPINQYSSIQQRYLDHLFVLIYFFILVLPLIFFCRNLLLKKLKKAKTENYNKSSYLANMSHEIRTPMNAIVGFAELLKQPDVSKSEQSGYIDIIKQNSDLLLNMINNILDLSKLEAKLVEKNSSQFCIKSLFSQIYNAHITQIRKTNLFLEHDIPEELRNTEIKSDRTLLFQVFSNLITNAIKVTREGKIRFGARLKNNRLSFFVFDTGPGIPPDQQKKIFERFSQLKNPSNGATNADGVGLGLSICKAILELLGGDIKLDSEVNKGSTFTFSFPADTIIANTNEYIQEKDSLLNEVDEVCQK